MNQPGKKPSVAAFLLYALACPLLAWIAMRQVFTLFGGLALKRPDPFNPYVFASAAGLWGFCVWRMLKRSDQRWGKRSLEFREVPLNSRFLHQMILDGLGPATRYVAQIRPPTTGEDQGEILSVLGAYEPFDVNDLDGRRQLAVSMIVYSLANMAHGGEHKYRRPTDAETQAGLSLWRGTKLIEVHYEDDGPTRRFYEPVGGVVIKEEDGKDYRL